MSKKKEIDIWKLAKETHEEVQTWPEWKRKAAEEWLFHESTDPRFNRCKCGYIDCNHRGY